MKTEKIILYSLATICIIALVLTAYYGVKENRDIKNSCKYYGGIPVLEFPRLPRCLIGNELYDFVKTEEGWKIPELNNPLLQKGDNQ